MNTEQMVYVVTETRDDDEYGFPDRAFSSMREARAYCKNHENRWWTPVPLDQYRIPI